MVETPLSYTRSTCSPLSVHVGVHVRGHVDPMAFNVERSSGGQGGRGWRPGRAMRPPMPPLPGRPDGLTCLGVLPGLLGPRAWPVGVETTFSNPLNYVQ
jgi:hypothetical protein